MVLLRAQLSSWDTRGRCHVLNEVTLFLGGGVDGRTSSSLGLGAAAGGGPGTSENRAEGGHGELL